jgi:hypothetical protein
VSSLDVSELSDALVVVETDAVELVELALAS